VGKLTFSIENLLDKGTPPLGTARAAALQPNLRQQSLYEYKGRGRTFGLNYA
jgi:iron complex outermembrane receptor protein